MGYDLQNILAQQCTQNTSNCSNTQCRHGVWPNKAKPGAESSSSAVCLHEEGHSPLIPPNQEMWQASVSIDPFFSSRWENLIQENQSPRVAGARAVAGPSFCCPDAEDTAGLFAWRVFAQRYGVPTPKHLEGPRAGVGGGRPLVGSGRGEGEGKWG